MKHLEQRERRDGRSGPIVLAAVTALVAASVAVVGASPAGAARSSSGRLQVCVSSARTQTAKYVIQRTGWSKTISLRSKAHHTVCGTSLNVRHATYKVTQRTPSGMRVSRVAVSPNARTVARNATGGWARAAVNARHLTRVAFGNAVIASPPSTPPPPTPNPAPGPSDPGTGYVEVCKQAGDGFVTGTVEVHVSAGATSIDQIVPVGQCTAPLQVPAGTATVSETVPAPYALSAVKTSPASALVSTDLAGASAKVTVAPSTDGSTETLVTLVNSTRLAQFKVCKTLDANAQDLIDTGHNAFAFDVSYTALNSDPFRTVVNVIVPSLGQAACVLYPIGLPLGTVVTVTERGSWASELTGIAVLPTAQDRGTTTGSAVFALGPNAGGITTATFTNRADGTIEICKRIDNGWMKKAESLSTGSLDGWSPYNGWAFQFSVNGGDPITVLAGQCSRPITVPAGTATVQELATDYFNLVGFTATGPDGSSRIASGTNPVTVNVPAGGVGNETLVIATNRVQTGQVKICKMLDPNVPVGKTFSFTTRFWIDGYSFSAYTELTPTAVGPDGEVCSYLSAPLPVIDPSGKPISFKTTEGNSPFGLKQDGSLLVEPTDIAYDGNGAMVSSKVWQSGDTSADDGTYYGCATIGQGVNVMTFTNGLVLDP